MVDFMMRKNDMDDCKKQNKFSQKKIWFDRIDEESWNQQSNVPCIYFDRYREKDWYCENNDNDNGNDDDTDDEYTKQTVAVCRL